MIQATTVPHRARLPLIAVAAFALGAFTAISAPRLSLGAAAPQAAVTLQLPTYAAPATVRPTMDTSTCGQGAYVTGDMVGNASPASVYAAMCGPR